MPVLFPEDADFLVAALTSECSGRDIPYAARVGIAAVVFNRIEDERYPDTAAGVLSAWEGDAFSLPYSASDAKEYRLTIDAFRSAEAGADPTGGALHFAVLEPGVVHESPFYTTVIDHIAFW